MLVRLSTQVISKDLQGAPPYRGLRVEDDGGAGLGSRDAVLARIARRNQALLNCMNGPRERDNFRPIQACGDLRDPGTRVETKQGGVSLGSDCIADPRKIRSVQVPDFLRREEGRRRRNVARVLIDNVEVAELGRLPELRLVWASDGEDPSGEFFVLGLDCIVDDKVEGVVRPW